MGNRLILFVWLLLLYAVPTWSAPMPRGSFLTQPVQSTWQLAQQVRTNPVVAARYEKHFGVSPSRFADYAQSQLRYQRLKSAGCYRVFFIRKDGSIGSNVRKLRKGTEVFMHVRTGKPVLLAECGNPMTTALPGYTAPTSQSTNRPASETADPEPVEPATETALSPPVSTLMPDTLEEQLLVQMQDAELPLWAADAMLSAPEFTLPQGVVTAFAPPASLTPMLMVGASGLFSLGGSVSGRGGSPPPPAVPEPGSLLLWLAGLGAAAVGRWRFLSKKDSKITRF
jgi:hypothetical protein